MPSPPDPNDHSSLRTFIRAYPGRTAATTALLLLSGLAEGIGVASLLPVLELAGGATVEDRSRLAEAIVQLARWLRLEPTLGALLTMVVVALAAKGVLRWLAMRQVGNTVARVASDLRLRLLRALLSARWDFVAGQRPGQVANAVGLEAFWASYAYRHACAALAAAIQAAVAACLICLASWRVAVFAVLAGGTSAALLSGFVHLGRRAGAAQTLAIQDLAGRLADVVQSGKALKAMGREHAFLRRLECAVETQRRAESRRVQAVESLHSLQEPVLAALVAVGLYVAVRWAAQPFAAVLLTAFLLHRLVGRVHLIQSEYQGLAAAEAAWRSIRSRLAVAESAREARGGWRPAPALVEGISLDGVGFGFGEREVLSDVTLFLPAGVLVAIVGASGAGKTTLVDLIAGLNRATRGRITVDGVPLDEIDPLAWRDQIGYVPQEPILLHGTVAENVGLGRPAVEREAVRRALVESGAWEFVSRLPGGIHTVIGEGGSQLSGGERQRLAIARALAGRPRLLVLDEPTSGLDAATEESICRTLRALRCGGRTVLVVSHREAPREAADLVCELDRGRLTVSRRLAEHEEARLDVRAQVADAGEALAILTPSPESPGTREGPEPIRHRDAG